MKKLPKTGDQIEFYITNPNWAEPMLMKGKVKEVSKLFGGRISIETGATSEDELVISLTSLK